MTKEEYKEKLRGFNSTPKYKSEVDFLFKIMRPIEGEKILDYGCGLGNLVHKLCDEYKAHAHGYDVINYRDKDDPYLFREQYHFKFDKVFFNHSLAHVPNARQKLNDLKELLKEGAKIYVITPNADYLDGLSNPDYIPDPTVVKHFYLRELLGMFIGCEFSILNVGQFGNNMIEEHGPEFNERLFIEAQWK